MLPDGGEWLDAGDESDSDEDFGTATIRSEAGEHEPEVAQETSTLLSTTPRRYGTYYHHPERRKRT